MRELGADNANSLINAADNSPTNTNRSIEYELRFGRKSGGKFAPVFNEAIKQKVFKALNIDTSSLIIEESINSYYDGNIRKIAVAVKDNDTGNSIVKESIECKEVVKRIDWYMDNGLCLRFALSYEKIPANEVEILCGLNTVQPLVTRKKVRQIYKDSQTGAELHFTTIESITKDGIKNSHELEIEYKKIKDIDLTIIAKILNCYN